MRNSTMLATLGVSLVMVLSLTEAPARQHSSEPAPRTATPRTATQEQSTRAGDTAATELTTGPMLSGVDPSVVYSVVPHELEIQLFSGEFEAWSKARTLYDAGEPVYVRLANLGDSTAFQWRLGTAPHPGGQTVGSGWEALTQPNVPGSWHHLDLQLWGLPFTPPTEPTDYYLQLIDDDGRASNPVVITYMENNSQTVFTSLGLDPFALDPLRAFVDLKRFEILDSDENSDEPYLVNLVLLIDGSTVDVFDLPGSTIRVLANENTHGNIPQYNGSIGTGSKVVIPDETGRFVATVAPVNPELADTNLFGNLITADQLTGAATIVVISVALEEDAMSTTAAQAMQSALVVSLRERLNEVIQSLAFVELLPLVVEGADGFDPMDLIPRPFEEGCATYEAANLVAPFDCRDGWVQMQDQVVDYAIDMATEAELNSWNLFQMIASAANPDDFIGVDMAIFNMEQIRTADAPIPFEFSYKKVVKTTVYDEQYVQDVIEYRVTGSVGRCVEADEGAPCIPYYAGVWYEGLWVPGTGPSTLF